MSILRQDIDSFLDWPCGTYRWWSWWENNLPDCRWWWKRWIVGARRRDRTPGSEERSRLLESSPAPTGSRLEPRSTGCCRSRPALPRTPARKPAVNYLRDTVDPVPYVLAKKWKKYCHIAIEIGSREDVSAELELRQNFGPSFATCAFF